MRYRNNIHPASIIGSMSIATIFILCLMLYSFIDDLNKDEEKWFFALITSICICLILSSIGLLKHRLWGRNILSFILHIFALAAILITIELFFTFDAIMGGRIMFVSSLIGLFPGSLAISILFYLHSESFVSSLMPIVKKATSKHSSPNRWSTKHKILGVIIALYIITWLFGVPAAQTYETRIIISRYKVISFSNQKLSDDPNYPAFKSYMAFPILPGFILLRQDGQAANLDGYGAWALYLWLGFDTKRLGSYHLWLS